MQQKLLPIRPLEQFRDKVARISTLGPYFENKQIKIKRSMEDFIIEYSQFPNSDVMDQLDALEMAVRSIIKLDSSKPLSVSGD